MSERIKQIFERYPSLPHLIVLAVSLWEARDKFIRRKKK